jgi:ubiquinone/menaquinone biosynthesis C-methylase UbiE
MACMTGQPADRAGVGDAYGRLARWQDALLEPLNRPLRDIALRVAPAREGARVLDVGCGTGTQLERYLKAGCVVSGVDMSEAMLARARSRLGADADLRLMSAESLPYEDASFDLVLASLMLHELTAEARDTVVREMVRVLFPAGRLLVIEFHPGPWRMPKGYLYRAISLLAESIAGHRDRSAAFLAAGGIPGLAARMGLPIEHTKVVAGGNMAFYVLAPQSTGT